jgi:hypothetical protein
MGILIPDNGRFRQPLNDVAVTRRYNGFMSQRRTDPIATPSAVAADLTVNPARGDGRWDQHPDGLRKMESLRKGAE